MHFYNARLDVFCCAVTNLKLLRARRCPGRGTQLITPMLLMSLEECNSCAWHNTSIQTQREADNYAGPTRRTSGDRRIGGTGAISITRGHQHACPGAD